VQDGNVSRAREGQTLSKFTSKVICLYVGSASPLLYKEGDKSTLYTMVLSSGDEEGSYCRIGLADLVTDGPLELDNSVDRDIKII
jgi:hypothetical protein